ncbi:hypothetical protein Drorol1_Dr00000697 [Drosera rotundifolia]
MHPQLLGISLNKHLFCFFCFNYSTITVKGSKVAKLQKLNPKLVQRSSQSFPQPSNRGVNLYGRMFLVSLVWDNFPFTTSNLVHFSLTQLRNFTPRQWERLCMMNNGSGEDECSVKVVVHVRPLIGDKRIQGCKDCINVVHGKPQVPI